MRHFTDYQDQRLADRYQALVDKVRAAERIHGDSEALTRAVATQYARLLAYKDESGTFIPHEKGQYYGQARSSIFRRSTRAL